jgi:hypothetical protein
MFDTIWVKKSRVSACIWQHDTYSLLFACNTLRFTILVGAGNPVDDHRYNRDDNTCKEC